MGWNARAKRTVVEADFGDLGGDMGESIVKFKIVSAIRIFKDIKIRFPATVSVFLLGAG